MLDAADEHGTKGLVFAVYTDQYEGTVCGNKVFHV